MKRLLLLVVGMLMVSTLAWAGVDWSRYSNRTVQSNSLTPGSCIIFQFTALTQDSGLLFVGGQGIVWQFEADNTGTNTLATADIYACTSQDGDEDGTNDKFSCSTLLWRDTDADGIADSAEMNGSVDGARGVSDPVYVAGLIYIDSTTAPAAGDEAEVVICSRKEG